jgi:Tetracyclin repressor-like, C-terminal domain
VPGFDPGPASESGSAALRLAAPFVDVVFDGWTPAQLAAVPLPDGGEPLAAAVPEGAPPAGALALFIELRARMHGLVMLEILGHLWPFGEVGEQFFAAAMGRMSDELDALQGRL